MCEIWNEFELKKPPLVTVPSRNAAKIATLHVAFNTYFNKYADEEKEFAESAALLSRLMARRKNSFRKMMGFRAIQKLNSALCRLLRVDLRRDLDYFRSAMPDAISAGLCAQAEVPTRNNLDYIILRLIGVHGIHQRIRDCCQDAAQYFAKVLSNNFFLEINTVLLAVLAKIHSLGALLGNKYVDLYAKLLPQRISFPQISAHSSLLTSGDETLPAKLETFELIVTDATVDAKNSRINFAAPATTTSAKIVASKIFQKIDLGEAVSRQEKLPGFELEQLDTVDDIKKFIAAENKQREKSLQNCITKQIQNHEWLGVKKLFERKIAANEHKKAISVFKKFLSTKI